MADAIPGLLGTGDDTPPPDAPPGLTPIYDPATGQFLGYERAPDAPLPARTAPPLPEDRAAGDTDPIEVNTDLPLPPLPPASIPARVLQAVNPIGSAEAAPRRLPLPDAYPLDAHGQRIMPSTSAAPDDAPVNAGHIGDSRPLPVPDLTDEAGNPIAPPPGALPSMGDPNAGILSRPWNYLVGASHPAEYGDAPELSDSDMFTPAQKLQLNTVMALGGPAAAGDSAVKMLGPGARLTTDVQGNPIVTHPDGGVAYLQKPGSLLSRSQVLGGIGALPALGAALVTGGIPALAGRGVLNTVARSVIQGGVQAGVNLGAQFGARSLGSDQGINLPNAVTTAIGGGLAEPAAILATKLGVGVPAAAVRAARGGPQYLTPDAAARPATSPLVWDDLTPHAQGLLGQLNISSGTLPPDLTTGAIQRWQQWAPTFAAGQQMANDPEIMRRTLAASRFNVPITLGQATGNPAQLSREDVLRQSRRPENSLARQTLDDFGTTRPPGAPPSAQQAAFDAARARLPGIREAGPPAPGASPEADAGQQLRNTLQLRGARLRAATSAAYGRLNASTGAAMRALPIGDQVNFHTSASRQILDAMTALDLPHDEAAEVVRRVARLIGNPQENEGWVAQHILGTGGGGRRDPWLRSFNLGDYNETRRALGRMYDGATPTKQLAIRRATEALDDAVDTADASGAVTGPADQLAALRTARAASNREKQFVDPRNQVANRFMRIAMRPGVSGQEVADALLTAGSLGSSSGQTMQVIQHMESMFPRGGQAFDAVRSGVAHRVVFGADQIPSASTYLNTANRIDRFLDGRGNEVGRRLFTDSERAELRDFSYFMRIMNETAKQNASGTAYALPATQQTVAKWLTDNAGRIPFLNKVLADGSRGMARDAATATGGQLTGPDLRDVPIGMLRRLAPGVGGEEGPDVVPPAAAFTARHMPGPVAGLLFSSWDHRE